MSPRQDLPSGLTDAEFAVVRGYLLAEAGLVFDHNRRAGLSSTVLERVRESGAASVMTYLARLTDGADAQERQRLVDAVTVQETRFFRNPPQMEALRRRVLPDLLRRAGSTGRPLTIWSAGCSTGEEPYTLAMLLLELAPSLSTLGAVRIIGSDVSADALRAAGRATYTGRTLEGMPALVADRWLEPRPGGAHGVKDQVRRLVELRLHNLVTDPPPFARGEVDLVVCRNVTIYFGRDTTARLMGTFHDVLRDDGYLLLGHSETLWQVSDAFTLMPVEDAFVYRRAAQEKAPARMPRHRGLGSTDTRRAHPTPPPAVTTARQAPASVPPGAPAAPTAGGPPTDRAARRLQQARTAYAAGRYDVAARAAAEAVAEDPLLTDGHVLLGEARTSLGQDEAAADALRKAVYLDPRQAPAHFLLAGALARTGRADQAAVSYRAAASALRRGTPEQHREFLGGREPGELAALCLQLAADLDEAATAPGAGGRR